MSSKNEAMGEQRYGHAVDHASCALGYDASGFLKR